MALKIKFPELLKVTSVLGKSAYESIYNGENETVSVGDAKLILFLKEALGFKLKILPPVDNAYGKELPDGSWTGMVGMLQREEADVAISRLSLSEERSKVIDFSFPYHTTFLTFITNKPEYLPNTYAILYPFTLCVWAVIFLSMIVLLLLAFAFENEKCSRRNMLLNIYGYLLERSVNVKFNKLSTKILMFAWLIGTMFITYSYKAVLLSFLTFPSVTGIRNIKELARASEESSFKCATNLRSYVTEYLLTSEDRSAKNIGKCIHKKQIQVPDIEEFLDNTEFRKAYVGSRSYLISMSKGYFLSDEAFNIDMLGIGARKSFCCKPILDQIIHRMYAAGLIQKLERDEIFFKSFAKNFMKLEKSIPNRKLSLIDFSGAFVILVCGYIIAILAFLAEILLNQNMPCS